jgi:hypothetical protein
VPAVTFTNASIGVQLPVGQLITNGNYIFSSSVNFGSLTSSFDPTNYAGIFYTLKASGSTTFTVTSSLQLDGVAQGGGTAGPGLTVQGQGFSGQCNYYDTWTTLKITLIVSGST